MPKVPYQFYLLASDCLSNSSFLEIAWLLEESEYAAMISSDNACTMLILELKHRWYAPCVICLSATSTRLCGAHSTARGYRAPPYSIVTISSRGAAFSMAFTRTSIGFFLVLRSTNARTCSRIWYAVCAFPVTCPLVLLCFLPLWPTPMI